MTGSASPASDAGAPATHARAPLGRLRRALRALLRSKSSERQQHELRLARILDLFEEHVYAGEITPDGRYVHHASPISIGSLIGGPLPDGALQGEFWESRIVPSDWPLYEAFNGRLLRGEDAEVIYRLVGVDGVTRTLRDRARPRRTADGGILVEGIVSDVTAHEQAAARLAEASDRFTSLLDVVGAHVYLALALPDGTLEELFQGPGGDRLLGGAEPDPEMVNWDAAVHPDDRPAYDAFNEELCRGVDGEVTYRLIGADGITRWVHDRAACRRRPDGAFEVSGIVSDVTERRRLEDDLKRSMAQMQRAHRELELARAAAELRASTDELTATFNRRRFAEIAAESIAAADERCALLLLDADHFKQINDAYGHAVGDAVLVGLAERLARGLEPGGAARSSRSFCATSGPRPSSPSGRSDCAGPSTRARSSTGSCVSSSPSRSDVRSPPTARRRSTRSSKPRTAACTPPSTRAETGYRQSPPWAAPAHLLRSPRPWGWPGPWRTRAASGRASRRSMPSRSRAWRHGPLSISASRCARSSAAGSADGSTTSASSRSPSRS
jgi:PAS domain-containing protein